MKSRTKFILNTAAAAIIVIFISLMLFSFLISTKIVELVFFGFLQFSAITVFSIYAFFKSLSLKTYLGYLKIQHEREQEKLRVLKEIQDFEERNLI